jgi:hypothetical protein
MDLTNTPLASFGPDHVFWNSNYTGKAVPEGCYRLCAESLEGFYPSLSPTSPVGYSVSVAIGGTQQRTFTGALVADGANFSTLCAPTDKTLPNEFNHGWFVGEFGYPQVNMDFASDPLNCGGCNKKCASSAICRNSVCVSTGDLRITLVSWNRTGDLDLLVFPPTPDGLVSWEDPGPRNRTAWGRLEMENQALGPENTFWNQSLLINGATYPTVLGQYRIVSLPCAPPRSALTRFLVCGHNAIHPWGFLAEPCGIHRRSG